MQKTIVFVCLMLTLATCSGDDDPPVKFPVDKVEGYRPMYLSADVIRAGIILQPARPLLKPGKIYTVGMYLFINELNIGVHLFDNTNRAEPVPLGFLLIPGNTDVALNNAVLYANNLTDLIALNVTDLNNVREINRIPQNYWSWSVGLPPPDGSYFECIDNTSGVLIGWERTILTNPKCYR